MLIFNITHKRRCWRTKPTHKFAGKANKRAEVEGQTREAVSFCQIVFTLPAHMVRAVDVSSGSRRSFRLSKKDDNRDFLPKV